MKVEILHVRDSDGGCDHVVLVDGERVEPVIETVDPGRGHLLSEWDTDTVLLETRGYTDGFRAIVAAERNSVRDSPYIEED